MTRSEQFSTWELFLGEITRNISPGRKDIERSLGFLRSKKACSDIRFNAIVSVRYMAAFEQAINEYLHPPVDFKQANIKAELIHFGSLFEGVSEILLSHLFNKNSFDLNDYNSWFPKQKTKDLIVEGERLSKKQQKGRIQPLTFKATIDTLSAWNKDKNSEDSQFAEYLRVINMLREERNKVHVNQMVSSSIFHEEYKLVEVREKWLKVVEIC